MNNRIKELADQCTDYAFGESELVEYFDKAQFAELLIKECMVVVSRKCASPTAYNAIVEHFGVEE